MSDSIHGMTTGNGANLPSFWGHQYFRSGVLPVRIVSRHTNLTKSVSLHNPDEVEMLYVYGGKGRLIVNNRAYELEAGVCVQLYPYHYYRIEIPRGQSIQAAICQLNVGTVFYIYASPMFRLDKNLIGTEPYYIRLKGDDAYEMFDLWNRLVMLNTCEEAFRDHMRFHTFLQIFNLFERHRQRILE